MATKPKRKSTSAGPRRGGTLSATSTTPVTVTAPVSVPAPEAEIVEETTTTTTVTTTTSEVDVPVDDDRLKRPDLIEAIAKRVSLKRSEAKMVFDVVLDEIGKALDASDEVVVPPLGKFMVKKRMEKPGGTMLTLKLKRAAEDPTAGDLAPLAETDEDG